MNGSSGTGPIRCLGYNAKGRLIATVDALDARREDIDPNDVQRAVDAAVDAAQDQTKNILLSLYKIDCNSYVLVNSVDLSEPQNDLEQAISSIPDYISKNLSSIVVEAERVRNMRQKQYNDSAKYQMDCKRYEKHEDEDYDIVSVKYVGIGGSN